MFYWVLNNQYKNWVLNKRVKDLSEWALNKDKKFVVIELQLVEFEILNHYTKLGSIEYSIINKKSTKIEYSIQE